MTTVHLLRFGEKETAAVGTVAGGGGRETAADAHTLPFGSEVVIPRVDARAGRVASALSSFQSAFPSHEQLACTVQRAARYCHSFYSNNLASPTSRIPYNMT